MRTSSASSGAWAETARITGPTETSRSNGTNRTTLLPVGGSSEASPTGSQKQRQAQQSEVEQHLAPDREALQPVRPGVAGEQEHLVDQHRAVPHGEAAPPSSGSASRATMGWTWNNRNEPKKIVTV